MKNTKAVLQGHMAPAIDWEELRRRLEIGRAALETGLATGVEEKRQIFVREFRTNVSRQFFLKEKCGM